MTSSRVAVRRISTPRSGSCAIAFAAHSCAALSQAKDEALRLLFRLASTLWCHIELVLQCMMLRQGCSEETAVEGQDLPCSYLAHHELENVSMRIIFLTITMLSGSAVIPND